MFTIFIPTTLLQKFSILNHSQTKELLFMALMESCPNLEIKEESEVQIKNFSMHRCGRKNRQGDGVAMCINNEIINETNFFLFQFFF